MDPSYIKREVYIPPDLDKMTGDSRKWYLAGVANADKDLTIFKDMSTKLSKGEEDVQEIFKGQLQILISQANKANDNTKVLVPKLRSLVDRLSNYASPISFLNKIKLKAAIWYINGNRDNKSFYLLNGAGLWCDKRINLLKHIESPEAKKIEKELKAFEEQLFYARDELDDAIFQVYQGIAKLMELVGDIHNNEEAIREVVKDLGENGCKKLAIVMNTSQDSVDFIKGRIDGVDKD